MAIVQNNNLQVFAKMKYIGTETFGNVFTLHVDDTNAQSQANILDDIAEYVEGVYTPLIGAMVATLVFDEITIYNLTALISEPTIPWPTLTAGAVAGTDAVPEAVSAFMFARTGVKRAIGKKFFPGLTETNTASGLWVVGLVAALGTSLANWITPFTGTNGVVLIPGVWQKAINNFEEFTEGVVRDLPGYQRRRKRGVGQ